MDHITSGSAKLDLERVHIADVKIHGGTERLSWIRTGDRSVNIVITEKLVGRKVGSPRLVGHLRVDEGEDEIKALCRDYVCRQNDRNLDPTPVPIRRIRVEDLRADQEVEYGLEPERLVGAL